MEALTVEQLIAELERIAVRYGKDLPIYIGTEDTPMVSDMLVVSYDPAVLNEPKMILID